MLNYCGPVRVQCWQATCMALKRQHKTHKMTTNDMKMGWICDNHEETTNTKVKWLLLKCKLPQAAPRRSLYYYYHTVLTCFWSSCCLLFIGGPVGTWTGETFDVFENVVFPLWNIVGLALGSVGAYNKNIYGTSASNITTSVYVWRKPSTLNVSYLNPSAVTT